jgi:hypothetical protein
MLLHTKKQHESLSPDDKSQILNKDADARKKKQESLSPEDKDLFEKNNTATQHKHYKSLTPDQKAEVLKINAATHKKQWKSLSPEQSIAAGNDYGRLGSLKPLNGTTRTACVPVQLYNIELQI